MDGQIVNFNQKQLQSFRVLAIFYLSEEGNTTFQGTDIPHRGGRIDTITVDSYVSFHYLCMNTEAIFDLGKNEHLTGQYHILYHIIDLVRKKTTILIPLGEG